jgi:selenide,water dikinase
MGHGRRCDTRRLVPLAGDHAHLVVLQAIGEHPEPGASMILVAKDAATPYSGMLPGHVID